MTATAQDLFGTDEPPPVRRRVAAGDLTAILEDGNLRSIRFGGVEVLRAINYLARDTGWGTYAASISDLQVAEGPEQFSVTYAARCQGPEGRFDYAMTITGTAAGVLVMSASGLAVTKFPTNRIGFVLLHPAEVAGLPLAIETKEGTRNSLRFPERIDANSPATGIRAMTHSPAPGLTVRVEMTGDVFEMEDQRNWADASFKTYVRPLSRPRPYILEQGTHDQQSVTVTVKVAAGKPGTSRKTDMPEPRFNVGGVIGTMPQMALFADRPEALAGDVAQIPFGLAQHLVLRWAPGQGTDDLAAGLALAAAIGAAPVVEAILPAREPAAEAAALLAALGKGGPPPSLLVAPRREFKTSTTASLPPGEVPVDALISALRALGFSGRIVAGTPSFFTEFNRNPPGPLADAVYFGCCGTVHAADDVSVMETLSVYPEILLSAAILSAGRQIWLGPCTLGARHAPYGVSVSANPLGKRIAMAEHDPRHGALFGAAHAVGIAAACAGSVVECLTLAAPFGPFGLIGEDGRQFPLLAVHAALAEATGCARREVTFPGLSVIAWQRGGQTQMLVSNPGEDTIRANLPSALHVRLLSADATWAAQLAGQLDLDPYRTALIAFSSV